MSHSKIILLVGITMSIVMAALSTILLSKGSLNAQDLTSKNSVGGHTPGYPIIHTTGDVLNPTSFNIDSKDSVVDPMKFLREFNYGRVSILPNGTQVERIHLDSI